MRRQILAILLLALATSPLLATATEYTYEDLSASMNANNTDILAAMEDYRTAGIDVKDAKSGYHPQISYTLAGSYVYNRQTMSLDTESFQNADLKDYVSLQDPSYNPFLDMVTLNIPNPISIPVEVNAPYLNAEVSLVQPIYTWGKISNNVKMSEEIEEARALQVGDTERQLDAQLKAYLTSLYYLEEMSSLLDSMIEDANELVTLAEGSGKTGVLLETDVASARVSASQTALAKTQIDSQIDVILSNLEVMTGVNGLSVDNISYTPDEGWIEEIASADRTLLELQATGNSQATIQMVDHMVKAAGYAENAASGSMYMVPDIALSVSANYTAPLNSSFVDESAWGVTVAVALQGTVWDGGGKLNDKDRAESALRSAQTARTQAVNTIRTTLAENFASIDLAQANIDWQNANIALLETELRTEEAKLELGASSRSDVLEKRMELNQARLSLLQEKVSLATAAYTVEYLTGYESVN